MKLALGAEGLEPIPWDPRPLVPPRAPDSGNSGHWRAQPCSCLHAGELPDTSIAALLILQDLTARTNTSSFPTPSSSFLPIRTVKKKPTQLILLLLSMAIIHRALPKHRNFHPPAIYTVNKNGSSNLRQGLQLGTHFTSPSGRERSEDLISRFTRGVGQESVPFS